MKAQELLRRYQLGERDFRDANLRGQSFQGLDLSGANLEGADIRGANFSDTTLIGANFSHAKAGLQRRWVAGLTMFSFLLAGIAGIVPGINGSFVGKIFNAEYLDQFASGWVALIIQIAFFAVFLRKGVSLTGAVAIAIAFTVGGALAGAVADAVTGGVGGAIAFAICGAGAVIGGVGVAFAVAHAVAVTGTFGFAGAGAFAVAHAVGLFFSFAFAFDGALAGTFTLIGAFAVAGAGANFLVSAYVGWQALKGNPRYAPIRSAAIAFAAWGGTSFWRANLTNANFNQARLKSVDLRKATLTRTSWLQTQQLDRVRPGTSFLDNPQVRSLVQTGQGQGLDFTDQNLRGINLANAQLEGASFRAADLSESNLQDANLTSSNLVQTQLDQTNFTGACLTGATIEDWGITGDTNLQGVSCDYVYMRWVKPGDPDQDQWRKPDNHAETFEHGEFGDFIKPIVNTLGQ